VWLPTLTVAWGITATLQCLIKNEPGFYAARFFLGVSEAGLFPGEFGPALSCPMEPVLTRLPSDRDHLRLLVVLQA
jgi:hypothetical protein